MEAMLTQIQRVQGQVRAIIGILQKLDAEFSETLDRAADDGKFDPKWKTDSGRFLSDAGIDEMRRLIALGWDDRQISERLKVAVQTVKWRRTDIELENFKKK